MNSSEWRGKPCPISEHAKNNPVQSDLTKYRCRDPILTPDEERELVRRAQAGDGSAKQEIAKRYGRLLLKLAGKYYGPPFEERLAQAQIGLLKAIHDFDLARNVRLATAVGTYVRNEIWTFVRSHHRRWLLHDPGAHVSLSSFEPEAPERSDRDGERWETWEPRRAGYRRPFGRVIWWWRPPAWARNQLGVGRSRSAVRTVPMRALEPTQRLLKQIGRLYRFDCWFPRLGDCKLWSKHVVGVEFKDLPKPTPLAEQSHAAVTYKYFNPERGPKPPQTQRAGGTVKIAYPSSATRHAELQRDMAACNEKHVSMWNMSGRIRKYHGTLNVLAANVDLDNGEQWQNSAALITKETLNARRPEFELVGAVPPRAGGDHRLLRSGDTAAHM
jgi:Sigma-70 region 2